MIFYLRNIGLGCPLKIKTMKDNYSYKLVFFTYKIRILEENIDRGVFMKKKKLYKSNGIKTASPADTLELEDVKNLKIILNNIISEIGVCGL